MRSPRRSRCSRRWPTPRATAASRCACAAACTSASTSGATTISSARAVNRAARIMSAAHGGQVLVSRGRRGRSSRDRLPAGRRAARSRAACACATSRAPSTSTRSCIPQLRRDFPALRSLEATPNNLPQQVTSFIGRERELAEVKRRCSRSTRLLTLLGIGRHRQDAAVAAGRGRRRWTTIPDGVWFVELAPLHDARLVPQAVASVLGVKEEAGHPVVEALVKFVARPAAAARPRQLRAPRRARARSSRKQLLQSGPHLKILASSREPLHVAGEAIYPLPPLAVPDPRRRVHADSARRSYEAVRLFVERATAAQPAFRLTTQNAIAVAEICRRLDGIPLAIELAAARVRALSVETDRGAALTIASACSTGGDRTALPRQQTLRALIDWSYDLLTEPERALFRRLAVFAGGWTLEAAEAVCAGGDARRRRGARPARRPGREVAGRRWTPKAGATGLLETVRQYAQERLERVGRDARRARGTSRSISRFAEKASAGTRRAGAGALARAARPRAREPPRRARVVRPAPTAAPSWACGSSTRSSSTGSSAACSASATASPCEALARPGAQERTLARCRALHAAGQVCILHGPLRRSAACISRRASRSRGSSATRRRCRMVLQPLGSAALGRGRPREPRAAICEEALDARARASGDKRELGRGPQRAGAAPPRRGRPRCRRTALRERRWRSRASSATGKHRDRAAQPRDGVDRRGALDDARQRNAARGAGDRRGDRLEAAGQSALEVAAGLAALRATNGSARRASIGAAEAQTMHTALQRDPADEAFLAAADRSAHALRLAPPRSPPPMRPGRARPL